MRLEHLHAYPVPTFSSRTAPLAPTALERWALGRIQRALAPAPIRFVLWDGFTLSPPEGPPVATIVIRNRRALFAWLWDPDLNFGDAYMFGAVEVRGDLVPLLEAVYRALADSPTRPWRPWHAIERRTRGPGQRPSALRPGQRLLPPVAGPGDGLHLRVLSRAGRDARSGAGGEDGSGLPQARAAARRARRRSRLRLGRAGAVHGQAVRRHGPGLQHLDRADRLGARAGGAGGARRSRRVRRGRLSQRAGRVRRVRLGRHARARGRCRTTPTLGQRDRAHRSRARGAGPAALHRPQPAGAAQPLDPQANLPRRVPADAARGVRAGPRAAGILRAATSRTSGCTTRRRSSTGCAASRPRPATCRTMFDDAFVRAWRLYLAGSQAAFTTGSMQLFQVVFARGGNNAMPWTRAT